ncbi:ATP synthase epsilon subunit [Sulfolobus acidocaldarius SUSAZ]|nr:ATP synthase epsilon subunit [Sulfolobus acidocaldarius SUSAZ]
MAEAYINELKSKLDARKKEILSQLNEEYNKILKSRFEDLESVKRNILKEVQNI